jgi:hypothetical protein
MMSDRSNVREDANAAEGQTQATGYQPPHLTRIGNVRDLLAGGGGTVPDADPTAIEDQSTPQ